MMKQTNFKDSEGHPPRSKSQVGQDLVEFAFLISLFLIVVMAIIEFSAFFYFLSSLNAASRNSVRFAIAENNLVDCSGIQAAATNRAATIAAIDNVSIQYDLSGTVFSCPPGEAISAGDEITVSVSSTYDPLLSLFDYFLQGTYETSSTRSVLVNLELAD